MRGVDVDPDVLRRRLRPVGGKPLTLVLTRIGSGSAARAVAFICRADRCLGTMRRSLRPLSVAVLLAACALPAAPAWALPGDCAFLGAVRSDGVCHVQTSTPAYTMNLDVPLDYPDEQAVVDYLVATRDGFINVAQNPDARNLPYEMDVTAESFSSQQTCSPCSPCSRTSVARIRRRGTRPSPTTSNVADRSRSTPCSRQMRILWGRSSLIVARDLGGQTGLPVFPGEGLDPGHYQNFAITDDAVIFFSAVPKCCRPTPGHLGLSAAQCYSALPAIRGDLHS